MGDQMQHKYLTRPAILAVSDIPTEDVDVPQWGGIVRVRGMTGTERDAFETALVKKDPVKGRRNGSDPEVDTRNLRAKLCASCIIDADGDRLFTDDDIPELGKKSGAALAKIFDVASRLSGITDDDVKEMETAMVTNPLDGSV